MDGSRAPRLLTGSQRTQRRWELDGRSSAPEVGQADVLIMCHVTGAVRPGFVKALEAI
jgi:hypothetical protein